MNDQNNNVLEFKDVWKIYRMGDEKINALAGINLNIKNGSFTSIMGPSGSGNQPCSTWRDTGHAHQGTLLMNGKDTSTLSGKEQATFRRNKIGFVFQRFNLMPQLSALETFYYP